MGGTPFGIILAGGRARRLGGGDKPLRRLGDRPILAHVVARIAPQVDRLALNANGDPARFAAWPLPVLPDTPPEGSGSLAGPLAGPLAGLLAGMRWAASFGCETVVSVPGDTPFLPHDLVARLLAACGSARAAVAGSGDRLHPVIGCWSVGLAEDLQSQLALGRSRATDWAARTGAAVAAFAATPRDPFFNINSPEDLAAAEALLAGGCDR
ncbi:MAG TPA: molybdenum cofactor guanylyltransferase MobA [Acetobacteraceae bacterium]|nr:molybdenum cofactor guanylyltransferase MobA [Acetobacteraceae bacterium]